MLSPCVEKISVSTPGELGLVDHLGEAEVQPLVREAGGDLADEAAGVGVACLHAQTPAALDVVAVGVLREQALDQAGSDLER